MGFLSKLQKKLSAGEAIAIGALFTGFGFTLAGQNAEKKAEIEFGKELRSSGVTEKNIASVTAAADDMSKASNENGVGLGVVVTTILGGLTANALNEAKRNKQGPLR